MTNSEEKKEKKFSWLAKDKRPFIIAGPCSAETREQVFETGRQLKQTNKMQKERHVTMCIIHKGFSGFRAVYPASVSAGNLIGLNPAITYEIIH